jgi:2'-5' RNA ligase
LEALFLRPRQVRYQVALRPDISNDNDGTSDDDSAESTAISIINNGTRYNFLHDMQSLRYALVAYVKSPVGEFVENLRRELHPELPHLAAHITFLPPRPLRGTEGAALQALEAICGQAEPFEVTLGDMESFVPTTPTVYIRVAHAASRLRELHDQLNTQALAFAEEWPYIPHVTIVKMATEAAAEQALEIARERWRQYSGSRRILLDRLTFVREDAANCWVDLAPVLLGGSLVSP